MSKLVQALFRFLPKQIAAIAWDGDIHLREGAFLTKDLEAHERVHLAQQARYGKWKWLLKYHTDRRFRFDQEIEAYRAQVRAGASERWAATMLMNYYGIGMSFEETLREISK